MERAEPHDSRAFALGETRSLGDRSYSQTPSFGSAEDGSAVWGSVASRAAAAARDMIAGRERPPGSAEPSDVDEDERHPDEPLYDRERARSSWAGVGTYIGRYIVLNTLGEGGMGVVYQALDRSLDRQVAIKVLGQDVGARHQRRLVREAKALALLSHPNVVQVYEVSEHRGQSFVVMELVRGQTLRQWQCRHPRPDWRACVRAYLQAAEGLSAAHGCDLVHRDFKPSNAMIDDQGRVRVLDFGLARTAADASTGGTRAPSRGSSPRVSVTDRARRATLTETGVVLGTPAYMSLEQMRGEEIDVRSDQFSFCVSLYEAIFGQRPFAGRSIEELRRAIGEQGSAMVPAAPGIPAQVGRILARGLAAAPEDRWPSMEALIIELEGLLQSRGRRSTMLAVVGGGALAIAGSLGFWGYSVHQSVRTHQAELAERCSGAQAQLEEVWGDARRAEVEAAVLGTQLAYAPDAWERVGRQLDDYAGAWTRKYTQICEATRVTLEQSEEHMELRLGCLRKNKAALREAIGLLASGEAAVVREATTLVTSLPELSRCDDVDALLSGRAPSADAQLARQVEQERENNERIRALEVVGSYDEALVEVDAAMARADALAHGPLLAEMLLLRGVVYSKRGQRAEAAADMERAYTLSVEHGHDGVTMDSVTKLILVVGQHQARPEAGLQWGKTALALALGPKGGPRDEADVRSNIGAVLLKQQKLDEAMLELQRALALYEEFGPPPATKRIGMLVSVGGILRQQDEVEEARDYFLQALTIAEEALGPHHPGVIMPLNNLGIVTYEQGDHAQAVAYYRRAEALITDVFGSRHPNLSAVLNNMAVVLRSQGNNDEAIEHYQRAASISEQTQGRNHSGRIFPLVGIAGLALERGDLPLARRSAEDAVSVSESAEVSPMHASMAKFVLARVLWTIPAERARARDLAQQAHDLDVTVPVYSEERAAIEDWLAEHPRP